MESCKPTSPLMMLRKLNNLSQKQLALQANISLNWIRRFESGKNVYVLKNLPRVAIYFNVSTDFLLGISNYILPQP